jgi:hypothetical protein
MDDMTPAGPPASVRPAVAGVAGGVGTTTVARVLDALDRGVFTGRPAEVLVCRATGESLIRAARAAQLIVSQGGPRPVVAVSATSPAGPSRPTSARIRLLEPHTAGVVVLPHVRRWRDLAVPLDEVTGLLSRPLSEVPRVLRRYAVAAELVRARVEGSRGVPRGPSRHRPAVRAFVPTTTSREATR